MNKTKNIDSCYIYSFYRFLILGDQLLKGLKIFSDNTIVYVDYDETYGLTTNSPTFEWPQYW